MKGQVCEEPLGHVGRKDDVYCILNDRIVYPPEEVRRKYHTNNIEVLSDNIGTVSIYLPGTGTVLLVVRFCGFCGGPKRLINIFYSYLSSQIPA